MVQRSRQRPRVGDAEKRVDESSLFEAQVADADERAGESAAVPLPAEEVFSVLRNGRRRAVLSYLARRPKGVASVNDLSQAVTAAEHDIPAEHVTERQRKCVYVSLLQVHLPALVEANVVSWNESAGTVRGERSVGALAAVTDLLDRACDADAER